MTAVPDRSASTKPLNWAQIDTVLLDMDGTLLDLHYDNHIWNTVLPERVARREFATDSPNRRQIDQVAERLFSRMSTVYGTLEFYNLRFWAELTGLDLVALHHEFADLIVYRPGADAFLTALGESARQVILATNAHRDGLSVKHQHTGIMSRFDAIVSSHDYGAPKEEQKFWHSLQAAHPFNPERALFIDDNLKVLGSAETFGIGALLCITQPDSRKPPRPELGYPAVNDLGELLPLPRATAA